MPSDCGCPHHTVAATTVFVYLYARYVETYRRIDYGSHDCQSGAGGWNRVRP